MKKKLAVMLLVLISALTAPSLMAQLNWRFDIGGMFQREREACPRYRSDYDYSHSLMFCPALYLQAPMKSVENPFFIETGLQYLIKRTNFKCEHGYDSKREYIESCLQIPLKLGWRKHIKGSNWLELSIGPYGGYCLENGEFGVGIQPAVVFRHKCISVGVSYQNPIFYNPSKEMPENTVTLNFGLNFGNKAWKWIGLGAMTAVTVGSAAATIYGATQGVSNSSTNPNPSGYTNDSYSNSHHNNNGSKSEDFSLSEQTSRNRDKATYERYDSQLAIIFAGNQEATIEQIRDMQKKMKELREKWEKRGKGWTKLPNETK